MNAMNVDHILDTMNAEGVEYLLIGGMNFLLRHQPVLTDDVDLWICDTDANRARSERALIRLAAAWGTTLKDWKPAYPTPNGLAESPVGLRADDGPRCTGYLPIPPWTG